MFKFQFPVISWRVIDGDTVECMLDQGFNTYQKVHIRVKGVDAPEMSKKPQKAAALACQRYVEEWLGSRKATLMAVSFEADKYGDRWLGDFFSLDSIGRSLGDCLFMDGMAHKYAGDKKTVWTKEELDKIASWGSVPVEK